MVEHYRPISDLEEKRRVELADQGYDVGTIANILREERKARLSVLNQPKIVSSHSEPVELDKPRANPGRIIRDQEVAEVVEKGLKRPPNPRGGII